MLILGSTILGLDNSFSPVPSSINDINYFSLGSGTYDAVYASNNADIELTRELMTEWNNDTIFAGSFDTGINLSNVDFTLDTVSHILIKKREKNTFKWTTIDVRRINTLEDFNIAGIDIFNAGNTQYQYCLVPVLNGIEGNYNIVEAKSDFDGVFIVERDVIYGTTLDVTCNTSRNHHVIKQESLFNRYPSIVYNSDSNYEIGTVEGYFCKYDSNKYEYYPEDSVNYRKEFVDFLTNQKPKILKLHDGRIWLINVDETSVSDSEDGHYLHRKTSFSFVESGNCRDEHDLYDAGLIDVDSDFWSYGI